MPTLMCCIRAEGAREIASLPSRDRGQVCIYSTFPHIPLSDFMGYVVVILLDFQLITHFSLGAMASFLIDLLLHSVCLLTLVLYIGFCFW